MDKNHDVIIFISKYLTRPRVASFGNIIKIATMFIKTTFKDPPPQKKKKEKEKIETKY